MILVTGMPQAGRGFMYKVLSENGGVFTPRVWGSLTDTIHPWCTDEGTAITSAIDEGIGSKGLEQLLNVIPLCWKFWKCEIVFKTSELVFYPDVVSKVFSRVIVCFRPISEWEKTILLRKKDSVDGWVSKKDTVTWRTQYNERIEKSTNVILELARIWSEASQALVENLQRKGIKVYTWKFGDREGFVKLLSDFLVPGDKIEEIWKKYWAGSILDGKGINSKEVV